MRKEITLPKSEEEAPMGTVYAEITLKNAGDVSEFQRGHIGEQDVRTTTVQALVDTGAGSLVISEPVREKLGLAIKGLRSAALANGGREVCRLTEPVEIHWKDRYTTCHALVLPARRRGHPFGRYSP